MRCDAMNKLKSFEGGFSRFDMSTMELPVELSKFDDSGRWLCYVSVALNKQRVSVEPVHGNSGSDLLNENFLYLDDSSLKVVSMEWHLLSSTDTLCVFLGLSNGEIWIYSPVANEIVYKMSTENSYEIQDLKITDNGNYLWCVDSDDVFYKFDVTDFTLKDHFKVETCSQLNKICLVPGDDSKLLAASHSIFLVDVAARKIVQTYPGHISPVTHLFAFNKQCFLSGAINDRFLNVYEIETSMTKAVLVLQSNLTTLSSQNDQSIAATTEDGDVEIFSDPLVASNLASNKRRANSKSKQSNKKVHVKKDSLKPLRVIDVSINLDVLTVCWLQNATIPHFAQLKWQDLPLDYDLEVSTNISKRGGKNDRSLYGTEIAAATNYAEGNAKVTSGDNFRHVNDAIKQWELELIEQERENDNRGDDENLTASLADQLEATSLSRIQVGKKKNSTATTVGTVTVVLSQALQANDHSLLETVLNNQDERVIRDTIFRLKPPLAVILLERLAERIARQTHRQGSLNVWVKWCLIIHGGYLVAIPNLMSSLSSLHSTLKRRSDLLPTLLALESRLEYALNRVPEDPLHEDEEDLEEVLEEQEEDVEYNEELDDAGLIEDGEEDDDEEIGYYEESETEGTVANGLSSDQSDGDGHDSDEAGYSDVEIQ